MPNLVGIGNTQTPTNSMLGGLAYQNPKNASLESVNIKHITKISQTLKPGTVIGDIFVYDTSRDSDGGAWRYRTQNTSWYNETLGTLLRGNRREFPAIAILVSLEGGNNEHGGIGYCFDIYDGDDPECPLWMRFPIESYNTTANWGTQLKFYTHSTATSDLDELKERMRLNSDGTLMLGTTNLVGAQSGNVDSMVALYQRGQIAVTNNDADFSMFVNKRDSTTGGLIRFRYNGSTIGSITNDTSSVTYNTSSDYRLKENVVTDWDATTRLKQLKPSRFNFKVDKDKTVDGFLAHEVSSIVPEAVSGEKDAVDKDGNIDPQGIDQSKLVPLLTKALQEAISEIDTLKEKVTALEAK